ncbi:hypothetical protein D1P53_003875 [Cryptococcus gattii VGV]|nr:hypothetical protein D1P53_003875 [Cryptococcus gattii VGV]
MYLGLETESAFLTHRLSVTQSDKHPSSSGHDGRPERVATFSEHSREIHFHKGNAQVNVPPKVEGKTGLSSRPKPQSSPRSRTKSGPMVGPSEAGKSQLGRPLVPLISPTSLSDTSNLQLSPVISKSSFSDDGSPVILPPSRIPTRAHSKSREGSVPDSSLTTDGPHSMLGLSSSSAIPIATGRTSRSPHLQGEISVAQVKELADGPSAKRSGGQFSGELEHRRFREDSPPLDPARITEGFIKNELPPFIMSPEEALRIAERGHDFESDDDAQLRDLHHLELDPHIVSSTSQEMGLAEGKGEKRKRAVTLKTGGRNRRIAARSSNGVREPDFVAKPRIQTGSTPPAAAISYPISQTSRSISMKAFSSTPRTPPSHNTLPDSSSRLGVAAHLIPPENTCKPPEGANWDEVVLPTVAKKLGIREARNIDKLSEPDAEDLAVEWDKNGTPIKWVKKKMEDSTPLDKQTDFETKSPNSKLMGLRFNPTLEPSPASPFRQSDYDTQRLDTIGLGPQREAPGPYTTPPPLLKTISQTSIALKSSLLKKASMQSVTKPPSLRSVQGVSPAQPPASGATHRITDAVYEEGMDKHNGVTSVKANLSGVGNVQSEKAMGSRPNKKAREDSHSKGCGCAVM